MLEGRRHLLLGSVGGERCFGHNFGSKTVPVHIESIKTLGESSLHHPVITTTRSIRQTSPNSSPRRNCKLDFLSRMMDGGRGYDFFDDLDEAGLTGAAFSVGSGGDGIFDESTAV